MLRLKGKKEVIAYWVRLLRPKAPALGGTLSLEKVVGAQSSERHKAMLTSTADRSIILPLSVSAASAFASSDGLDLSASGIMNQPT